MQVCVEDEFNLFVPNAFSPNADGINDAFFIQTSVLCSEAVRTEHLRPLGSRDLVHGGPL